MPSVLTIPKKLLRTTTGNAILEIEKSAGQKNIFACQFNPDELHISTQGKFTSIERQGEDSPIIQYMGGSSAVLDLRLFFDTSTSYEIRTGDLSKPKKEQAEDVSVYTNTIMSLVRIEDKVGRPPTVTFLWGSFQFSGFVDNVDVKYTMFEMGGIPVRAEVSFKISSSDLLYLSSEKKQKGFSDSTKCAAMTADSTLWDIAEKECGDSSSWKRIAKENNIMNPLEVPAGTWLKIPAAKKS